MTSSKEEEDVLEVSLQDGVSFDISAESAEELKAQGNKAFASQQYDLALEKYTKALAIDTKSHVLWANKSAAHFKKKAYKEALVSASTSISLNPSYAKGHFRKASALGALKRYSLSQKAYEKASSLSESLKSKNEMTALANKMKSKIITLYPESNTSRFIEKLLDNGGGDIEGVFKTLSQSDAEFQRIMYPGMSSEKIKKNNLPTSFNNLCKVYCSQLEDLVPVVKQKAESVLTNVKAKALADDPTDVMSKDTEAVLYPQVLQEAFAREVFKMVQAVNAAGNAYSIANSPIATVVGTLNDDLYYDNLSPSVISTVLVDKKIGFQDDFLGSDWMPLLQKDLERFKKTTNATSTSTCLIEPDDVSENFPALSELVLRLHALPYELNIAKKDLADLVVPQRNCTLLSSRGVPTSRSDSSITCMYFFENNEDIRVKQDQVVLIPKGNEFLQNKKNADGEFNVITFWIYNK